MLVDTAALTGEPLPRKVPRPDRPDEPQGAGKMLLSGCIVKPLGEALEGDLRQGGGDGERKDGDDLGVGLQGWRGEQLMGRVN